LDADQSAAVLTGELRRERPFVFIRYGDGALECIFRGRGHTCDGEEYSTELGNALMNGWKSLMAGVNGGRTVYVGDWRSASFSGPDDQSRYEKEYQWLIGKAEPKWLHFEALLLMRESSALFEFYRAVKEDSRRKLYMGPASHAKAAKMMGAAHLVTPMGGLFRQWTSLQEKLFDLQFDVLLYGAGMAGSLPVISCWDLFPDRTYINLGSAFDPLCLERKTRRQQVSPVRARAFFAGLEG
jgi:hypothetical protein